MLELKDQERPQMLFLRLKMLKISSTLTFTDEVTVGASSSDSFDIGGTKVKVHSCRGKG